MKLERLAARDAQATNRIDAALASLASNHGIGTDALEAFRAARTRDRAVTAMLRNEAIADFLDALTGARIRKPARVASEGLEERLTAINGVGPKLARQIIDVLEAS